MKGRDVLVIVHTEEKDNENDDPYWVSLIPIIIDSIKTVDMDILYVPARPLYVRGTELFSPTENLAKQVIKKGGKIVVELRDSYLYNRGIVKDILLSFLKEKKLKPKNFFFMGHVGNVCVANYLLAATSLFPAADKYYVKGCVFFSSEKREELTIASYTKAIPNFHYITKEEFLKFNENNSH